MNSRGANDQPGYDRVARLFHWAIVLVLAAQYVVAWTMPSINRKTLNEGLVSVHLSLGTLILLIMLARLAWRLRFPPRGVHADLPRWLAWSGTALHLTLYALLIVLPVLGWINAGYRDWTVGLFGLFDLPQLVSKGSVFGHQMGDLHAELANILLYLLGLHIVGVLYHVIIRRDGVFQRMWLTTSRLKIGDPA